MVVRNIEVLNVHELADSLSKITRAFVPQSNLTEDQLLQLHNLAGVLLDRSANLIRFVPVDLSWLWILDNELLKRPKSI